MFERYSEPARRVIFIARLEAGRLRFDEIESQHLLLGFVLEDQRRSERGFDSDEVTLQDKDPFLERAVAEKLRTSLSIYGLRAEPQSRYGDMPLTEEVREILKATAELAGKRIVHPLHLLRAMLADENSATYRLLMANGVTREKVDEALGPR